MATCKFKIGDKVIGNHPTRYAYTKKGWKGIVTEVRPNGWFTAKGDGNPAHNGTFTGLEPQYFDIISTNEKIVITHDGKVTTATMYGVMGNKTTATARCAPEDKFDFAVGAKLAMERLMAKVNPINICGFKVGDRVHFNGINGTVICLASSGTSRIGVELDKGTYFSHDCSGVPLIAGTPSKKCTCRWLKPADITHGEVPEPPKYYNGKVVCVASDYPSHFTVGKIYTFVDGTVKDNEGDVRYRGNPIKDPSEIVSIYKFIPLVEDKNDPLTIEELNKMDGQKVYVIRLDEKRVETPEHRFCGWHKVNVSKGQLIDHKGDHYNISSMNESYGYHAYRQAPSK